MLHVQNLEKFYGAFKILDDISFHVRPREKAALIGVNGCGKTTLLRIIAGLMEPDSGSVIFTSSSRTALMSQEITVKPENTLFEEMRLALPDVVEMEKRLRFLEDEMGRNSDNMEIMEELISDYTVLMERFDASSGHDINWKIDRVIQGLGFSLSDRERKVSEFSGGWQMRIELAKLLLKDMDLLLLDEPTNHLDLNAVEWLEEYLKDYPGAVIIVSHDRYFLNRATTKTIYLQKGSVRTYPGNYDFFIKKRNEDWDLQEKAYNDQQKKLEKDLRFIERFRAKNTIATRVKSREKMLGKMDLLERPDVAKKTINLSFESDERQMTVVYGFKDLVKEYPGKTVPLLGEMEILHGERVSIVGDNGCGKTTLLKILAGLDRSYKGKLKTHDNADIKWYLQNQAESLDENNTVFEEFRGSAPTSYSDTALRTLLGCFLFKADDVFKKISVLSGGEKSRLALAKMVYTKSNVLLLDEPTNHLDIESREVLADALNDFEGTIIVISHDRLFIDQICGRVIELQDGNLKSYPGNYTYYREKKNSIKSAAAREEAKRKVQKARILRENPEISKEESLKKEILRVEELITEIETKIALIESDLENPDNMGDEEKMKNLVMQYADEKNMLDESMSLWEKLHDEIENPD